MDCNLAVIVVTHNEGYGLVRAVQSIVNAREEVTRIYLVDDGTDRKDNRAMQQLYQATKLLGDAHMPYVFLQFPHMGAGPARQLAYSHVVAAGDIHMLTSCDSDDRYGRGILAALRRTFLRHAGRVDLVVPRHILRIRESDNRRETMTLTIPKCPIDLENPSDELVEAMVQLACVGATFGASVDAIRPHRLGSFAESADMLDEWIEMYARWLGMGARCVYADIAPTDSYHYVLHDKGNPNDFRRTLHRERRHEAARKGFKAAAERLLKLDQPQASLA